MILLVNLTSLQIAPLLIIQDLALKLIRNNFTQRIGPNKNFAKNLTLPEFMKEIAFKVILPKKQLPLKLGPKNGF